MKHQYHSNGKLLLTGEYLVLLGAEALALPLKRGQTLQVKPLEEKDRLIWRSLYNGSIFFEAVFSTDNLLIIQTNNDDLAGFLQNLLRKALEYIPSFVKKTGYMVESFLGFPLEWGLGSSSSLIANISEWLNVNPFTLNQQITQGSGYDIACARSDQPIIYKNSGSQPDYRQVNLNLPFKENIYFIYTGRKQSSAREVKKFMEAPAPSRHLFSTLKDINTRVINSRKLEDFERALREHEEMTGAMLNEPPVQQRYYFDFPGTIKSLGAWGGDFILATWKGNKEELKEYFRKHQMEIIFSWDELIKNQDHAG